MDAPLILFPYEQEYLVEILRAFERAVECGQLPNDKDYLADLQRHSVQLLEALNPKQPAFH